MKPESFAGGRYVVERPLGHGGMADVVLAHDTTLDRKVAVKLLAERLGGDTELRERFLRESRFAAQLSHPNIVAVYDTGEEAERPYIVMEWVDGVSLAEALQARGPFPAAEIAALGRQACAGLEHAHDRGLVHRDVKPQNLLLREDGTLKVADFGIARAGDGTATLTQAGTVLGTAAYMAPEVIAGEPAGPAADVYALGAVLYELTTARPPRRVATIAELARAEPTPPPSAHAEGIPDHLEETIMRCLAGDPAHRPSVAEVARELEAPTLSRRPTEVVRRVERTRLDRRLWLAPALVLAAIAGTLALALSGDESSRPARAEPVPAGSTPADDARNLAAWLRENAG